MLLKKLKISQNFHVIFHLEFKILIFHEILKSYSQHIHISIRLVKDKCDTFLTLKTRSNNKRLVSVVYVLLQSMDQKADYKIQLNNKQTHKQPIAMLNMISQCNQHLHGIHRPGRMVW